MSIQCTICLSCIRPNEPANATSCGHVFHETCLVEWFKQSRTCPQCRDRCDHKQVRRLYFSVEMNGSTVDVDSIQTDLDDSRLQVRNLNAELFSKNQDILKLRDTQKISKATIIGLENQLQLAKVQVQNAKSVISSQKTDLDRLRTAEKELNEKIQTINNLNYIKDIMESGSIKIEIEELLRSQPDPKILATLVAMHRNELIKVKRTKDEVHNNRRVCEDENKKLKNQIKQLTDRINTLESDNYKLQDDLSRIKRGNEPNTITNEVHTSSLSSSIQISPPAAPSIQTSSVPKTESPYLNIKQSNVGLTPLLHGKRKPEPEPTALSYKNQYTIFRNPRKLIKTVSKDHTSMRIYNGYGGSDRKENVIGVANNSSNLI